MSLFKALKILLKLDDKMAIVLGFKHWHASTAFNTIRYFKEEADKWNIKSRCSSVCKANAEAYNFMSNYLEQGKQIWVKQSTCDYYNA